MPTTTAASTDSFTVQNNPLIVPATIDNQKTLFNVGGGTIYYYSTNAVSSATNDGSLTSGQSLSFSSPKWFVCLANLPASVLVSGTVQGDTIQISGPPTSGTGGTLAGQAAAGAIVTDTANSGVQYVNEGTAAAPYWSPVAYDQPRLFGAVSDWRGSPGTALSDTGAANLHPSGIRVFGQGMTETDAGALQNAAGEGNLELRMTTTDEAAHTIALGLAAGVYQPDQHKLLVVDCEMTNVSAITLRGMGIGFVGTAADAFDPPITCATTTSTLVQDDLALMHFNVGYTATTKWYIAHNKSDEAASHAVLDSGTVVPAAATYQRLRVEIDAAGTMRSFVNKALVYTQAAALDVDEECSPIFYIESTSAAVKSCDVRRFATWAYRLV